MNEKIWICYYFIRTRYFNKFKTKNSIRRYQLRKIKKHINFLKENSDFYSAIKSKIFDGEDSNSKITPDELIAKELGNLEMMNKKKMMHNFDVLNTVGIDKEKALAVALEAEKNRDFSSKVDSITIGLSSGTSGNRGLFIASEKERAMWAGVILAKGLPKGKVFGNRIAFFLRANSNLYETIDSHFIKFKYFDIYDDMEKNIRALDGFEPTILVAPPSVLIIIAKSVEDKLLNINPLKIISVAEILEKKDESYIKKAFGKDIIHQIYQCTEGLLAMTCEYGKLHVNEELIYVEKEVISGNRFIPIITDFVRRSQPIIRYRLNDILIESEDQCKCGNKSLILKKIEGREDDVFKFTSIEDEGKDVIVFSDFIRRCFLHVENIKEYRVVQVSKDRLELYLEFTGGNCKDDILSEIGELSRKLKFEMPMIIFKEYSFDNSKKLKRVECKVEEKN